MINDLLGLLWPKLGVLALIYGLIFVMVVLDLWSGVRKAKRRGEFTSSIGLRRTTEKLAKYYNLIIALTVTDLLQMGFLGYYNMENESSIPLLPFVTALGALLVCIVEIKSIYESADKKLQGQYQEAAKQLSELLKNPNKQAAIAALLDQISKKQDNDQQRTTEQ